MAFLTQLYREDKLMTTEAMEKIIVRKDRCARISEEEKKNSPSEGRRINIQWNATA